MRLYLSLFVIGPFWARYITVFGAISTSAYFAVLMQLTAVSFRKMGFLALVFRLAISNCPVPNFWFLHPNFSVK